MKNELNQVHKTTEDIPSLFE